MKRGRQVSAPFFLKRAICYYYLLLTFYSLVRIKPHNTLIVAIFKNLALVKSFTHNLSSFDSYRELVNTVTGKPDWINLNKDLLVVK